MSPRAGSSSTSSPDWVGRRDLVVAVDGPLAGRWYFATGDHSWAQLVEAARRMAAAGRPERDPVLDYVVDTRPAKLVTHPTEAAAGRPLHYAPHRAAPPPAD